MTDERLKELEAIARAATPGSWKIGYKDGSGVWCEDAEKACIVAETDDSILHAKLISNCADIKHIVAFSPTTALELIATVTRYRDALQYVCFSGDKDANWSDNWSEVYLKARQALDEEKRDT